MMEGALQPEHIHRYVWDQNQLILLGALVLLAVYILLQSGHQRELNREIRALQEKLDQVELAAASAGEGAPDPAVMARLGAIEALLRDLPPPRARGPRLERGRGPGVVEARGGGDVLVSKRVRPSRPGGAEWVEVNWRGDA
ncbi:hypothetical protein [Oecophyllibacter saccharovorans]|uniref:Uncharacterized protein n=1 Tax=Oecophyllibacter saccharovorans TaxID=2558360 RepID=A0A506UM89_9PROT|nr:hypothetical protein [Oecophyllibacter saccharovorans]TPW34425.1 hypothetical protein E3202_08030 [Oecophyllibacter saccharovorans]